MKKSDLAAKGFKRYVRLVVIAGLYRFSPISWRGVLSLAVLVFDVVVYAMAFSVAMEVLFGLGGSERFVLILMSLVVLRWSLGCALQASRTAQFIHMFRPIYHHTVLAAAVVAMGAPTFVFILSLGFIIATFGLLGLSESAVLHSIVWGSYAVAVQFFWNIPLVLVVLYARLQRWFTTEVPIFFVFGLFLILSPVFYQLSDIPLSGNQLLTSFNPASHLIAAYQNALWFGQVPSLEVLPWSVLPGLFLLAVLVWIGMWTPGRKAGLIVNTEIAQSRILILEGRYWRYGEETEVPSSVRTYRPWHGDLPWVRGVDLLRLMLANSVEYERAVVAFETMSEVKGEHFLVGMPLPVYTERIRDRLCVAIALARVAGDILLDGTCKVEGEGDARTINNVIRAFGPYGPRRLFLRCLPETADLLVKHQV